MLPVNRSSVVSKISLKESTVSNSNEVSGWKIVSVVIGGTFLVAVLGIGLGWFSRASNLAQETVFAPREEAVRREVFEKSRAYNAGTIQNMRSAQMDYIGAPADRRLGLGSVILQQYADYPEEAMPRDLRDFVVCLRQHQGQNYDCSPNATR